MSMKKLFSTVLVGMVFVSLLSVPGYCETQNLLKNPSFEESNNGKATNWDLYDGANKQGVTCTVVKDGPQEGSSSFKISNTVPNDTLVTQKIATEPEKVYKVTYWLKTENIKNQGGSPNVTLFYVSNNSGCKGILTGPEISNTNNKWQKQEFYFTTLKGVNDPLTFCLRLGGQGTVNEGSAYFDNLSVTLEDKADASLKNYGFYVPDSAPASDSNGSAASDSSKPFNFKTPLFILLGIVVLGLLIFVELKLSKRNKQNKDDNKDFDGSTEDLEDTESDEKFADEEASVDNASDDDTKK